jgi:hypothetical protein
MAGIWLERENAAVNSIMSGNNACGTLATAGASGRLETFLRMMLRPTLSVCADEAEALARQRDAALAQAEARRRILAEVAANGGLTGDLAKAVELAALATPTS